MVRGGLGGGIGGIRSVGGGFRELAAGAQRPIDFVGRDMHEAETGACAGFQAAMVMPRGLKQLEGADDIGVQKVAGSVNRAIDVGFRREIDYRAGLPALEQ